jgi:hypothetical protein
MLFYYLNTMKKYAFLFIAISGVAMLVSACGSEKKESNPKLIGSWKSKNSESSLKITDKKFIMDGDEQSAEDYFTKGDTIYTSFEGNQPYTKFVIKKLDAQALSLVYPDSVVVEFAR